jgi:peptidoglycan/xylan/chitin deacetylase (PgdA/CDA1 family)
MSLFTASVRLRFSALVILSVLFISTPVIALADTDVLVGLNPGFETVSGSTPTGWVADTYADTGASITATHTTTNDAHAGVVAAKVEVTAVTGSADAKWILGPTTISVTAGQSYTFSDFYKSTTPTSVFIYANTGTSTWIGDAAASPDAWATFTGQTYLVPVGVTSITIGHTISAVGTLTTDDYSLIQSSSPSSFTKGMVTLTFDDGWDTFSAYAKPVLDTKNIKATNYIITGPEGSNITAATPNSGYMSAAQILALRDAGFDIQNHTNSHIDLAANPASWQIEINDSIAALKTFLGSASVVDNFAYPFGQYCAPTLSDCSGANVKAAVQAVPDMLGARSVDEGYNLASTDKFALKQQHIVNANVVPGFSLATVQGWIDYAIANKVWLILMFHDVYPTLAQCVDRANSATADLDCTDTVTLKGIVDYLADTTKVPAGSVLTMHEVLSNTVVPVAPTIAAHADVYAEATSTDVVVTYTAPTVAPGNTAATCTPASGSIFTLGSTTVTCSSTGAANTTFTVGVKAHVASVANAVSVSAVAGVATPVTLQATGSGTLTYATTSSPLFGTLTGTNGNLVYTPQASTTGFTDSFMFKVNDGLTDSAPATVTITVSLAPSIAATNITATPGQTDATITWNTVTSASSTVIYGTTASYGATTSVAALTSNHSVQLTGLTAGTLYHFAVISTDASNHTSTSTDQTFTTTVTPVTPPAPAPVTGGGGGGGGGGGYIYSGSLSIGYVNTNTTGGAVLGTTTTANGSSTNKFFFTKPLAYGSRGAEVTELHKVLIALGLLNIQAPTGNYLGMTLAAVKKFQAINNIEQLGMVGPKTRAALNK